MTKITQNNKSMSRYPGNVNNHISKIGLIRLYQSLLSQNKIKQDGPAHRRLIEITNRDEDLFPKKG